MIFIKKLSFGYIYEISLGILIIFSLIAELPESQDKALGWFVWGVFVLDYCIRFSLSKSKWEFVKKHPLDLVAMIPLDQLFRSIRLLRLFKLIRLFSIFNRNSPMLDLLTKKYKIDKIFVVVICLLFISAFPMYVVEPSFESYGDALWWTVVTTTTVGYGDLYPVTGVGRIIASCLMIVGIGLIGIVTGTVASIFTNKKVHLPDELELVHTKLEQYPDLNQADIDTMLNILQIYKTSLGNTIEERNHSSDE